MKTNPTRSFLLALALAAVALPSFAATATKLSSVANSITFRDGAGHRGDYGWNGGSSSAGAFDGNFTSAVYQNTAGAELVVSTTHIVSDPNGLPYVTEVKVGHNGTEYYSLYYTTEEEPADILNNAKDPRTWLPIDGAQHIKENGTKTYGVNKTATAVKYVFDSATSWAVALAEVEVWGYEYVPAVAVTISSLNRSITFRDGAGHRGDYGWNGGSSSAGAFDGNFTSYVYQNTAGAELVIPTTGVEDGSAWYVTDFIVGHNGTEYYSLYYTTEEEPADILNNAKDPRTWLPIDGAQHIKENGTKTYGVNKTATAVKYVFDSATSWAVALAEVEVWAMDPSTISCLHENMTDDSPAWTVCTPATCTENAIEERYCPDCNERFEREAPLSKLGHDFVATLIEEGTVSSYGRGEVNCSRCDYHLDFNGEPIDLASLGGLPINGIVQYTDLTVFSSGGQDGGITPASLIDNKWTDEFHESWFAEGLSTNEWIQFSFGTTIDLTKIEYSVLNQDQTVYFNKYDPATGEESPLAKVVIVKDTSDGALGYQRRTVTFTREAEGGEEPAPAPDPSRRSAPLLRSSPDDSNASAITVDAIRMRVGDVLDPDTGEVVKTYIGVQYGRPYHTKVCEVRPWGTVAGAAKVDSGAKPAFLFMQ